MGLPSLRTAVGGALIERNVVSTSGNSTQTVVYGKRLKFRINLFHCCVSVNNSNSLQSKLTELARY